MARPLTRRRTRDDRGELYRRPPEIEAAIDALDDQTQDELLTRSRIRDKSDRKYLPSEALVHILRALDPKRDKRYFTALYSELLRRIDRVLPDPRRLTSGDIELVREAERNAVRDRLQLALMEAIRGESDALDIYECRFDYAIAKSRAAGRGREQKRRSRNEPLPDEHQLETEDDEPNFNGLFQQLSTDPSSRIWLSAMIDALPNIERRTLQMFRDGYAITSNDPNEPTITKLLECEESTARKRRARFIRDMRTIVARERKP